MAERREKTGRDMILTMGVVGIAVVLIAIYGFHLSFGGLTPKSGPIPTADATATFTNAKGLFKKTFPVTVPQRIPAEWHPNSASVTDPAIDGPGTLPTVRGGWVLPDGSFITLIESAGSMTAVLVAEVGAAGPDKGVVTAGGATWTKTTGVRTEVAWVRTDGRTTYLITGDAGPDAFDTLADSIAP